MNSTSTNCISKLIYIYYKLSVIDVTSDFGIFIWPNSITIGVRHLKLENTLTSCPNVVFNSELQTAPEYKVKF